MYSNNASRIIKRAHGQKDSSSLMRIILIDYMNTFYLKSSNRLYRHTIHDALVNLPGYDCGNISGKR